MNKLTCAKAQRLIVSGLDEGLDRNDQERLDRHLAQCLACRAYQEETAGILGALEKRSTHDPGEDFWRLYQVSLDARLREREPVSRGLWTWANLAFAGGCAVILVVVGMGALEFFPGSPAGNGAQLAAMQEIDRLFGMGSEDWLLYEPRLPRLVAGYDAANGLYESLGSSWIDSVGYTDSW